MDAFTWVQEIQLYNLKVTERSPVNIHTANAGKLRGT
jgi:hypothetical protein